MNVEQLSSFASITPSNSISILISVVYNLLLLTRKPKRNGYIQPPSVLKFDKTVIQHTHKKLNYEIKYTCLM